MITTSQPVQHLAIIPDGNRRWAKKHAVNLQKKIYDQGGATTFAIIEAAFLQDIPYLTFWASSYANLQSRAPGFVAALEELMIKKFRELAKHPLIHEKEVRVEVLGEWRNVLKPKTIEAVQSAIEATAHYDKRLLTVLVGYDGQRERGAAVQTLLNEHAKAPDGDPLAAEQLLRWHAWTGQLPNVDLIIRTGAWEDPHNSASFLSFLSGDSQLAFPKVLWPDFSPKLLTTILDEFAQRERRMGR